MSRIGRLPIAVPACQAYFTSNVNKVLETEVDRLIFPLRMGDSELELAFDRGQIRKAIGGDDGQRQFAKLSGINRLRLGLGHRAISVP